VTEKPWGTGVAAEKLALPDWVAVIVQVPTIRIATVVPDTVQTDCVLEANNTAKVDDAVALSVNVPEPYTTFESVPKVIVCASCVTEKPWGTGVAGA